MSIGRVNVEHQKSGKPRYRINFHIDNVRTTVQRRRLKCGIIESFKSVAEAEEGLAVIRKHLRAGYDLKKSISMFTNIEAVLQEGGDPGWSDYGNVRKAKLRRLISEANNGKCQCCGRVPRNGRLVLDHDHDTDRIRGAICSACNNGLGGLGDDVKGLLMGIEYLGRYLKPEYFDLVPPYGSPSAPAVDIYGPPDGGRWRSGKRPCLTCGSFSRYRNGTCATCVRNNKIRKIEGAS